MAHKTLIDGTAYEISGGKALVDGTAYSIKNGKTLVDGTGYEIWFGAPIGDLAVGSSVFMDVGGVSTEFIVVHQGLPSTSYDASCDGTWLLMKDIYTEISWASTLINKYATSGMHNYLGNTFINLFDGGVKSVIKQVKIPYTDGPGVTGLLASGSSGLSTQVFLLSYTEVGFSGNSYANVEGTVLDYFGAGNSKMAYFEGYTTEWWLRSPSTQYNNSVWYVSSSGRAAVNTTGFSYGIRPALILPPETLVDSSFNVKA